MRTLTVTRTQPKSVSDQLTKTIAMVGEGIRNASTYFPLRDYAAKLAATAGPKDYYGQLAAVYNDLVRRWRYVRDPVFAEQIATSGPAIMDIVLGFAGGRGRGDCDDIAAALSAVMSSIGFPVRLVTSTPHGAIMPRHIYPEVFVRGLNKWIAADPVLHPRKGLGDQPLAKSRQRWDLFGREITTAGEELGNMGDPKVQEKNQFVDYGLENYGLAGDVGEEPLDWRQYGLLGFGAYYEEMGSIDGEALGILAEVEADEITGLARSPMIEVHPEDFRYIQAHGIPYDGMLALGDDGTVYEYDGLNGFFSKIFGGLKKVVGGVVKGAMKIGGKVIGIGKKLISKLPGGKYLVKIGEKLHATAMKFTRPLLKIVGPLAKKIGPIASIIPGYGPIIAVALEAGGTAAEILAKHGVAQDPKTGKLNFKSKEQYHAFSADMRRKAKMKRLEMKAAHRIWRGQYEKKHGRPGAAKHGKPGGAAWEAPAGGTFTAGSILKNLGYKAGR